MDVFEAINSRRSIRRYKSDPVKDEDIEKILEAGRQAPSATNDQPWHFIVIKDADYIKSLAEMVHAMIDARIAAAGDPERQKAMEDFRFLNTHFFTAPVVIAVLAKPWPSYRTDYVRQINDPGLQSVAGAIQNMLLAATALGYGTCWMTGPIDAAKDELEAMLAVEPPYYLVTFVPIGLADESPKARPRKPLSEVVTYWGS